MLVSMLMYVPFFREIFELAPLPVHFWALLFVYPPVMFFAEEGRKALMRRWEQRRSLAGGDI
jgi:hypothetical protein